MLYCIIFLYETFFKQSLKDHWKVHTLQQCGAQEISQSLSWYSVHGKTGREFIMSRFQSTKQLILTNAATNKYNWRQQSTT